MKKWIKYVLTGIFIAVSGGLILSFILGKVEQVNLYGGLKILIAHIGAFFTIRVPLYGILIAIVVLIISFVVYMEIFASDKREPEWKEYRKRMYKGVWFKWKYVGHSISSITPICECGCILSQHENNKVMYPFLRCPKCGNEYDINLYDYEGIREDLEKVIASDIESGDYKNKIR